MIEATVFLGAVIAGVTELVKYLRAKDYEKVVTICSAVLAGVVLALIDVEIGVQDISVALGVLLALSAVGVVGALKKVG